MPNHTANILEICGSKSEIDRFVQQVTSKYEDGDDHNFDFNKIVEMPECLNIGGVPGDSGEPEAVLQAKIDDPKTEDWDREQADKVLQMRKNKREVGYASWYDWCIDKWGTKWGAYDIGDWQFFAHNDKYFGCLYYQTAWSPPTELLIEASRQFHDLNFVNLAVDEGGGFVVQQFFDNGELSEIDYDWSSEEGIAIRQKCGYWYDDEEEDYEDEDDNE